MVDKKSFVANHFERDIIYYLVGAALRKGLGCLLTVEPSIASKSLCNDSQVAIVSRLVIDKEKAEERIDPRYLKTTKTKECKDGSFLYPNEEVYDLFVSVFENHILSALDNPMTICLVKDQIESFLEFSILESKEYFQLYDLIYDCCRENMALTERFKVHLRFLYINCGILSLLFSIYQDLRTRLLYILTKQYFQTGKPLRMIG